MLALQSLDGLSWAKIRVVARDLAASENTHDVVELALAELGSADGKHRMHATYLLGFTAEAHPANLSVLRERVVLDPSWEVQEALAQAFDAYCAAVGYQAALPVIDSWLANAHPNARRAVSEGLRPWTSNSRLYFAKNPAEAIRRLADLRRDPSDYVRHSAGNALRDIRRSFPDLVDAETTTWNLGDPSEAHTYQRVLRAR